MSIFRIVLTGGPCAGKTSAINIIKEFLEDKKINVLTINETATEMINSGITPQNIGQIQFQKKLLELQLNKESVYNRKALSNGKKTVIILDRGAMDGKAYLQENEFRKILEEFNLNENSLINSYDAVIFLDSVATCDSESYTTSNNSARSESADEAAKINTNTFEVWKYHNNFYKIENELDFEAKMSKILDIVNNII